MEFNKEDLTALFEEIVNVDNIELMDIPCVDLYMDQVTTFFDDRLKGLKRSEDDKILTKTMINNYVKAKLLTPVKGKKYNKDQIILLTLLYNLKHILSINDINLLFTPLLDVLMKPSENNAYLEILYSEFIKLQKFEQSKFMDDFDEKLSAVSVESLNSSEDELHKLLLLVLTLINSANIQRRMAEKIIDKYFIKKD